MLEVRDLQVAYGPIAAVRGLSFEVAAGELVAIIGANGAGKTTLLRTLIGLHRPAGGTMKFTPDDVPHLLGRLPAHQVVRLGMALVPQGRGILPQMTVLENLQMGAYARNVRHMGDDLQRVFELFPRLKERLRQLGGTLSGGEQQMLAIGRGLVARPKLLLLDEPSLGLAPLAIRDLFASIRKINDAGTTVLLVEQNALQALRVAGRAYVLEQGRAVLEGEGARLLADDRVRAAYLGG